MFRLKTMNNKSTYDCADENIGEKSPLATNTKRSMIIL